MQVPLSACGFGERRPGRPGTRAEPMHFCSVKFACVAQDRSPQDDRHLSPVQHASMLGGQLGRTHDAHPAAAQCPAAQRGRRHRPSSSAASWPVAHHHAYKPSSSAKRMQGDSLSLPTLNTHSNSRVQFDGSMTLRVHRCVCGWRVPCASSKEKQFACVKRLLANCAGIAHAEELAIMLGISAGIDGNLPHDDVCRKQSQQTHPRSAARTVLTPSASQLT